MAHDDRHDELERDHQTNPSDSSLADRTETGTADRGERAARADRAPEPDHLGAAERAFEESRGVERRSRESGKKPADESGG